MVKRKTRKRTTSAGRKRRNKIKKKRNIITRKNKRKRRRRGKKRKGGTKGKAPPSLTKRLLDRIKKKPKTEAFTKKRRSALKLPSKLRKMTQRSRDRKSVSFMPIQNRDSPATKMFDSKLQPPPQETQAPELVEMMEDLRVSSETQQQPKESKQ